MVLFDVVEGMPQGKALDLAEACPLYGSASSAPAPTISLILRIPM